MKIFKHATVILISLFVCLGIPTLMYVDVTALFSEDVDAVTRASIELPEQPSGVFLILMNTEKHPGTVEQWNTFFSGGDAGVIMSDVRCMVAEADATGIQLAERYQARLPENQMQIRHENGLLLASKAENALFDVIVLSQEVADIYGLQPIQEMDGVLAITLEGE